MSNKVTAPSIRAMGEAGQKIACVTAYDAALGEIADEAGVDVILVGDSLGNVVLGYKSTIPVTLEQMVHHTAATRAGVKRALLVADLPFGSYEASSRVALESAVKLMKAGAEAVKLEGDYPRAVAALVRAGIPCFGHLGLTPQSVNLFGGFKIQGKGEAGQEIQCQAKRLDSAGAAGIVLELIPDQLAAQITEEVGCPTIGIGAGPFCSGQIQVIHDILGFSETPPRHAKAYIQGRELLRDAISSYSAEVKAETFTVGAATGNGRNSS